MPRFVSIKHIAMIFALAASISAQKVAAPTADDIAASGSFNGQLYTNKTLGLTILAPGGWTFYTAEQNSDVVSNNREKNANDAASHTQVLFQAYPPKALSPEKSVLFSAGIETLETVETSKAYIERNKTLMIASPGVRVVKDTYAANIGNTAFTGLDIEGSSNGSPYRQSYLVTMRKNVAIFFVSTFYNDKNEFAVNASLKTIKFGK